MNYKKYILVVNILLMTIFVTNVFAEEWQINDIKYIFYTENIDGWNINPEDFVQGIELTQYPSLAHENQPDAFDIVIQVKHNLKENSKPIKIKFELWFLENLDVEAIDIDSVAAERTRRWNKSWEKEVEIPAVEFSGVYNFVLDRINLEDEFNKAKARDVYIEGWKTKVILSETELEKVMQITPF